MTTVFTNTRLLELRQQVDRIEQHQARGGPLTRLEQDYLDLYAIVQDPSLLNTGDTPFDSRPHRAFLDNR